MYSLIKKFFLAGWSTNICVTALTLLLMVTFISTIYDAKINIYGKSMPHSVK